MWSSYSPLIYSPTLFWEFSGAFFPVGISSVNFPLGGEPTLRYTRSGNLNKQTGMDGISQSCQLPLKQISATRVTAERGIAGRLAGRCSARSDSPCWLITSRAAALGRLRWITCPFSRGSVGFSSPPGLALLWGDATQMLMAFRNLQKVGLHLFPDFVLPFFPYLANVLLL